MQPMIRQHGEAQVPKEGAKASGAGRGAAGHMTQEPTLAGETIALIEQDTWQTLQI